MAVCASRSILSISLSTIKAVIYCCSWVFPCWSRHPVSLGFYQNLIELPSQKRGEIVKPWRAITRWRYAVAAFLYRNSRKLYFHHRFLPLFSDQSFYSRFVSENVCVAGYIDRMSRAGVARRCQKLLKSRRKIALGHDFADSSNPFSTGVWEILNSGGVAIKEVARTDRE